MIVSVTVLGSNDGTPAEVIGRKIVDYLEGGRALRPGQRPGRVVELPSPSGGTAAYYADSAGERPGHWVLGRSGAVDTTALAAYLAGVDPESGEPLVSARGSARRAERQREAPPRPEKEWSTTTEAARAIGVSPSYLRSQVRKAIAGGAPEEEVRWHDPGHYELHRSFVARLAAERKAPKVVAGYDLTFSVPKSVSILWAGGSDEVRTAVLDGLDEAVAAGLRYLEAQAIAVRVRGQSVPATGSVGADYLHTTSRALEPQLHHHVVLANVATGPDGKPRALDGRLLFRHAKTASYLAAAELRHQLTARLGVTWTDVHNGIAEVEGIPQTAMAEMSTRSKELAAALAEVGATSARARQVAAWDTRAKKEQGVDVGALFSSWDERLTAAGYGTDERRSVLGRVGSPGLFDEAERDVLAGVLSDERFAHLSAEQRAFVEALTTSGMRVQAGLGAAGTGKTTALSAVVAAWEASGYKVLGAAVGGTQAVVLSEETGIEARTLASVLARSLDHGDVSLVDDHTVVLVDEASLVSTKDFVALARLVEERGAALRLVGDPAQHTSVEAGGVFRYLVKHHEADTPALTAIYRQQGPEMEEVRKAATELREGKVAEALERLAADGRIHEAGSGDEAYDTLVRAWYGERQKRVADPSRRRSAMTAEHHVERQELNRRARELLAADGTLSGPELVVGEVSFRAGDEVVARLAERELRADGAPRDAH